MKILKEIIFNESEKKRLIIFAQENFQSEIQSNKGIKKAIKRGVIRLNKEIVKDGVFLKVGDKVQLIEQNIQKKAFVLGIKILYKDEHLAVVFKPAGIPVSGNLFKTLENALINNIKKSTLPDALPYPKPVHRIDKPTSGLIIVALTKKTLILLGKMFENKQIIKTYYAVVVGKAPHYKEIIKSIDNKEAITKFTTIRTIKSKNYKYLSLLKINIETGRKHQIRKHLSQEGFPVLGDKNYGFKNIDLAKKGLFLTSSELEFNHPITGELLNIKIELPKKFNNILNFENIDK